VLVVSLLLLAELLLEDEAMVVAELACNVDFLNGLVQSLGCVGSFGPAQVTPCLKHLHVKDVF
jgi:hypothetical protein